MFDDLEQRPRLHAGPVVDEPLEERPVDPDRRPRGENRERAHRHHTAADDRREQPGADAEPGDGEQENDADDVDEPREREEEVVGAEAEAAGELVPRRPLDESERDEDPGEDPRAAARTPGQRSEIGPRRNQNTGTKIAVRTRAVGECRADQRSAGSTLRVILDGDGQAQTGDRVGERDDGEHQAEQAAVGRAEQPGEQDGPDEAEAEAGSLAEQVELEGTTKHQEAIVNEEGTAEGAATGTGAPLPRSKEG